MRPQPGYEVGADLYVEACPEPYRGAVEPRMVDIFVDLVAQSGRVGTVIDVGCGPGQVAADLASRGLTVIGVDPSASMLRHARSIAPAVPFVHDDAMLAHPSFVDLPAAAIVARFSLMHIEPVKVPAVLARWAHVITPGGVLYVAGMSAVEAGAPVEFDHRMAPAWRWHPATLAASLADAGFTEVACMVAQADADHRFPEFHLFARHV